MDCESVHFNNISLLDNRKIFLKTEWTDLGINLVIIDEESSEKSTWEGFLPMWEIESKAKDLEVGFKDFLDNTKEALTTSTDEFIYELSQQGCFQWTKVEEVKILYGSVNMKQSECSSREIRNEMIKTIKEVRLQLKTKSTKLKDLKESYDKCLKEYNEVVESRNKDESELLSKVVLVLNSKKRRIQILEDNARESISHNSINSILDSQSQKNSQNSNLSSQELDPRPLPKRLKLPDKPFNQNHIKLDNVVEDAPEDSPIVDDVYNKETLDMNLIN